MIEQDTFSDNYKYQENALKNQIFHVTVKNDQNWCFWRYVSEDLYHLNTWNQKSLKFFFLNRTLRNIPYILYTGIVCWYLSAPSRFRDFDNTEHFLFKSKTNLSGICISLTWCLDHDIQLIIWKNTWQKSEIWKLSTWNLLNVFDCKPIAKICMKQKLCFYQEL